MALLEERKKKLRPRAVRSARKQLLPFLPV
jgi:hypothetical protein